MAPPNLRPVSRDQHNNRRWLRYTSYDFASGDAVVPLTSHEMQRAVLGLPTGFVAHEGRYLLMAVQGLLPGRNLWVSQDGRWLGGYIPAAYRGHPFRLGNTEDGRQILCVDEASGLVTEDTMQGEPFFADEGQLAKPVAEVLEFLGQLHAATAETARVCAVLQAHNLMRPWPIRMRGPSGEMREVEGLFCVDEAALDTLSGDAVAALREAGVLKMAYAQLLSMQHLQKLGELAKLHAQAAQALSSAPSGELDLEFLNQGGTISFGNLQ